MQLPQVHAFPTNIIIGYDNGLKNGEWYKTASPGQHNTVREGDWNQPPVGESLWVWLKGLLPYAALSSLDVQVAGGGSSSTHECRAFWSASRHPLALQECQVSLRHHAGFSCS